MSLDKQTSLQAMRTFARDVAREKGNDDSSSEPAATPAAPQEKDTRSHTAAPVASGKHNALPVKEDKTPKPKEPPKTDEKKPKKPEPKKKEKVTKKKETDTKEPARIPAFHELEKQPKHEDIVADKPKSDEKKPKQPEAKKEIPKKKPAPSKPVGGGTVITDNKKDRKPFFAELKKSLAAWLEKIKKELKPQKNTYTVTQTERRKGVVQKATSKTGTIFTADNETLKEKIKARQRAEKRDQEHDDLSWSPFTETGYPLLDGEHTESEDPRVITVAVTPKTTAVPKPKPVIKSTEKIAELRDPEEVPEIPVPEPEPEPPKAPEKPKSKPAPQPEKPDPTPPEPEPETDEPATDTEVEQADSVETAEPWRLEDVDLKDTNTLAMLVVGAILAIGIFAFVIFGIFGVGRGEPTAQPVDDTPVALFTNASLETITITDDGFNELVRTVNTSLFDVAPDSLVELRFVDANGAETPSALLMKTIRTVADDGFSDTVTEVRLVRTSDQSRALVLSVPDEVVARGGMLNWEDALYADVAGILNVQSAAPPSAGEFIDTQVGSLDVRSLQFDGGVLLVYTLTDDGKIIIASNSGVLATYTQ